MWACCVPVLSQVSCVDQVNEAEEERLRSEREHQRVTQLCQDAEAQVQTLQKALKKVILKSKPYFELKAQFNHILEVCKSDFVLEHKKHIPYSDKSEQELQMVFFTNVLYLWQV